MLKLLKINTLLLFLILTISFLLGFYIKFSNGNLNMIFGIIGNSVFLIWFLGLDAELSKRVPLKIRPSNTLFLINTVLLYMFYSVLLIFLGPDANFTVTGFAALPFFYFFYAFFSVFNHLTKLLAYAEEEIEVPLNKRVGDIFLFYFFFIGVWWLQPRIRAVLNKAPIDRISYSM